MKRCVKKFRKLFCFKFLLLFVLFSLTGNMSYAQSGITVSGTVKDNMGELPGVSVTVKGATGGVFTDLDGNYTISVPGEKSVLVFSFIGYETKSVQIGSTRKLDVVMVSDEKLLDEVVVIGYGTVKKRDLTGSVSSVKSDDITISPTSNVMEALQGRIAGMDILKTTGQIGSDVQVLLRGNRSIYGNNTPLFIIDGVIGSYEQVNPMDIESFDVLKDASSTAIYGSAGANGVVIITTKRGKEGKVGVNFDAFVGFSSDPKFYHGMKGDEWTNYQREAYKYLNGQYPSDMSSILTDATKLDAYNNNKWIDWVDEASGNTAVNQKYNVSVTAGNAKTKVFSSLSYDKQEGLLRNEDQNKYAMRLNIDQELSPWAKAGFTSNMVYSIRNNGVRNTFTKAIAAFPLGDAYDENGDINYEFAKDEYSPLGDFIKNQFVDNTRNTYLNANVYLEINPIKELTFRTVINGTLNNSRRGQFWGDRANANRPSYAGSPHAEITNNYSYRYMWDNIITYNKTFLTDHTVTGTVLSSWTKNENESNKAAASGQFLDSWSFYRLLAGTSARVESDYVQDMKMSYAMRLNYSYKGRYLVTFSNRWDGVSWFAKEHQWDSFPAGALAWRISDEAFMTGTKGWLDNLKLRIGYGVTGNDGGIGAYSSATNAYAYSSAGISLDGKIAPFTQFSGIYGNPSLGWEKSYNWNVGLDFAILNNRIDGSVDWFKTRTKDLLFKRVMPVTSGSTGWGAPLSSWENIAETSNHGIEVTINTRNVQTRDFTWNSNITFTWSKEKIESLPSGDLISENLFVGESIKAIYGYKYAGIWGTNATAEELAKYGVKPGWVRIETVPQTTTVNGEQVNDNGVHKYSEKDRQILGHSNPDFIVGLNNNLRYKSFDLSVFATARYGQTIASDLLGWYSAKTGSSNNQIAGADYWTENNQNAYYPVAGSGSEQTVMPALKYRDGSFIKVKNITLGYTLPKLFNIERCRVYATAYNPFLYVKDKQLKGTDPETNGSDSFPLYKQFVFGVNISF